ncbi:MAG: sensor histidine kinase [Chthoniobacterales bacterium]
MSESVPESEAAELRLPMRDVVRFVSQLSHDLRNHLNAAELQSAYVNELAEDAELKSELQRLRGMLGEMGGTLHRLMHSLAPAKLTEMPYDAESFVQDLQQKLTAQFAEESRAIDWTVKGESANFEIDPQLLQEAFLQIFTNAFQHGRSPGQLGAEAEVKGREFVFTLREPKQTFAAATANWGREPFHHVGHGHYGLGLHRVRNIIEAHRGRMTVRYDQPSASLVTVVTIPLAEAG